MAYNARRIDVLNAAEDMRHRTLSKIGRPLDRLIYLASLRDYNTGLYYHEGLAARFSQDVACEALADCHREVFHQLFLASLEELVEQLEAYVASTHAARGDFIAAWKGLEPYRVAVPVDTDPVSAEFFFSNLRIALAILQSRLHGRWAAPPAASPRPSPGL